MPPNQNKSGGGASFRERLLVADAEAKSDVASPVRSRLSRGPELSRESKAELFRALQSKRRLTSSRASELCNLVSEYLFDLFDANCMAEFQAIERFELAAMASFDESDDGEFTHAQYDLHRHFVRLMEGYVEAYICSPEVGSNLAEFYDAVHTQMHESQGGDDARECLSVLFEMADIRVWAAGIKQRIRHRNLYTNPHATTAAAAQAKKTLIDHADDFANAK